MKIIFAGLFAICLGLHAPAGRAELDIHTPFPDVFDMGVWSGQGDLSLARRGCIRAFSFWLFVPVGEQYQIKMTGGSSGNAFGMTLDGNRSQVLPLQLDVVDLATGGVQVLSPAVYSSDIDYRLFSCDRGGGLELRMTALGTELHKVPAGRYRLTVDLEARRSNNWNDADGQRGIVAELEVPGLVRISGLDDIVMPDYSGLGSGVIHNESFCVYTNAGSYIVTPTSTEGSSPGSFVLSDGQNELEYQLRVSNTANAANGAILTNGDPSQALAANLPTPLSLNCNSGDNAAIQIEIPAPNLQAVPAGTYTATLTIQVAPE